MDLFDTYRRMFASRDNRQTVVWWYCGVVASQREGVGEVPLVNAETIMAYRTRDLAPDRFTIDWTEVGYFRNLTTGEQLEGWFNPFRDLTEPYPRSFVDGPATFTISRAASGVQIDLVLHNARIDGVALAVSSNPASVGLVQTETKTRTFHRADGSLPTLDSDEATAIETVLSIWSPAATLADGACANVPSHGFYRSGSRGLGGSGSWATTTVRGTMQKARDDERVNRHRRHIGHSDDLRQGDLRPGGPGRPHGRHRRGHRPGHHHHRHAVREPGGQCRRPGL